MEIPITMLEMDMKLLIEEECMAEIYKMVQIFKTDQTKYLHLLYL